MTTHTAIRISDKEKQRIITDNGTYIISKITYVYLSKNSNMHGRYKGVLMVKYPDNDYWEPITGAIPSIPVKVKQSRKLINHSHKPLIVSSKPIKSTIPKLNTSKPIYWEYPKSHIVKEKKEFIHNPIIADMKGFKYGYTPSIKTKSGK